MTLTFLHTSPGAGVEDRACHAPSQLDRLVSQMLGECVSIIPFICMSKEQTNRAGRLFYVVTKKFWPCPHNCHEREEQPEKSMELYFFTLQKLDFVAR